MTFTDLMGGYGRAINQSRKRRHHALWTSFRLCRDCGQRVHRGDAIGYVGTSGRSTGPHLHYEMRINDTPVNPTKYPPISIANSGG